MVMAITLAHDIIRWIKWPSDLDFSGRFTTNSMFRKH